MTTKATPPPKQNILLTLASSRETGLIVFIIVLIGLMSLRSGSAFLSFENFRDILLTIGILMIVALAQTMVIITRGIDLSVSSMIGLVAMMVAFVIKANPEFSPLAAVLLGMALGAALGSVNGVLVTAGGVPPIIATLGTLSIYRGAVFLYSQGTYINAHEMSHSFKLLSKGMPLGLPNLVIIALVVGVIIYYFLNFTRPGRDIYAVGSTPGSSGRNPGAAHHFYGLPAIGAAVWAGRGVVGLAGGVGPN
ncbi:MAG: ABC transporter permease [Anaerolineae bacterium]